MKVKYVIHSVDDSQYLNLWQYTSKFVKRLGYIPVLVHITDNEQALHETCYGIELKVNKNNNVPTWFQAQVGRLWGTQFFGDDVILTSDIDMFLLNKEYFENSIESYTDDCFINLTSNAYKNEIRIPICYNAATGNTFKNVLNLPKEFNTFLEHLICNYGVSWDVDEKFLAKNVFCYNKYIGLYRHFNEKWEAEKRIDRNTWFVNSQLKNTYIDCHFLRPLQDNIEELNKLLTLYGIQH